MNTYHRSPQSYWYTASKTLAVICNDTAVPPVTLPLHLLLQMLCSQLGKGVQILDQTSFDKISGLIFANTDKQTHFSVKQKAKSSAINMVTFLASFERIFTFLK